MTCCYECTKRVKAIPPEYRVMSTNHTSAPYYCCNKSVVPQSQIFSPINSYKFQKGAHYGGWRQAQNQNKCKASQVKPYGVVSSTETKPVQKQVRFHDYPGDEFDPLGIHKVHRLSDMDIICRFVSRLNHNEFAHSARLNLPVQLANDDERLALTENFANTYVNNLPRMTFRRASSAVAPYHAYMTFYDWGGL